MCNRCEYITKIEYDRDDNMPFKARDIILISILILYVGFVILAFMRPIHRDLILSEREQTMLRSVIHINDEGETCVHANQLSVNGDNFISSEFENYTQKGIHIDNHGTLKSFRKDHISQPLYVFHSFNTSLIIEEYFHKIILECSNGMLGSKDKYNLKVKLIYENVSFNIDVSCHQRFVARRFNGFLACEIQEWNGTRTPLVTAKDRMIAIEIDNKQVSNDIEFAFQVFHL